MTEQPEAKKAPLIERLEAVPAYARLTIHDGHYSTSYYPVGAMAHEAAAELRRLHEVNAELLAALKLAEAGLADIGDADREPEDDLAWCERRAAEPLPIIRATIARAEGKT